jgi:hypothetical protein
MTMTDLATAYAALGKAYLDLADALTSAPDAPGAATAATWADGTPIEEPEEWPDQEAAQSYVEPKPAGSTAVCPAHNIEYRKGRYGPYCPSTSNDPKWSNEKGYCTVTPKSAAAWLRQHA